MDIVGVCCIVAATVAGLLGADLLVDLLHAAGWKGLGE